ncbi:MAG: hypothetical protein HY209_01025 [Candidatus Omnitrophica bacterium]|nr:hypothetical protein [Candidatus Omnitrophota bacterium]
MFALIKKGARLSEENRPLLWTELVLFSGLSGLMCRSWLALAVVSLALVFLMTRRNGMFYMIFAISFLWAVIPSGIGFAYGWIGAVITGGIAFFMGVKVHVNGLKWQWDEVVCRHDDSIEWKRTTWSGQNASRHPINIEN